MGTDIHIVIERRWRDKWVGVRSDHGFSRGSYRADTPSDWAAPAVGQRDYGFFSRLAGVRGDGPAPDGVPHDASDMALALLGGWDGDAHSMGHLPLAEFAMRWCAGDPEFLANMTAERLAGPDTMYSHLLDRASIGAFDFYDDTPVEDFRVVFWFDN